MWGAVPADTYYKFTTSYSSGKTIAPTSGETSNLITCGTSGSVASSSAKFADKSYSYGLKLGNTVAKGATIDISASTEHPAHVIIYCSASGKEIYLQYDNKTISSGYVYAAPTVVDLVTTNNGTHTLVTNGDTYCYEIKVLYEGNDNIITTAQSGVNMSLPATLTATTPELAFFKMVEVNITDGKFVFGGNRSGARRIVYFTANLTGKLTVEFENTSNSGRTGSILKMTDFKTVGDAIKTTQTLKSSGTKTETLEVDVEKGKMYAIAASGSDIRINSLSLASSSFTVTFHKNDGTETTATQTGIKPSTATNLNLLTTIGWSRTGYDFGGWAESASGDAKFSDGGSITLSSNKDLYAKWTANTYDIILDANGGAADGSAKATYDGGISDYTPATPSGEGQTLLGYFSATTGGNKIIDALGALVADKWTDTKTNRLYAQWATSCTVRFMANGEVFDTQTVGLGGNATTPEGTPEAPQGKGFGGWSDADGGAAVDVESITINGDKDFYAVWKDLRTVSFATGCGSAIDPVTVIDGQPVAKPTDPTRTNWEITKWQLEGADYNFDSPVTSDIELTAVWQRKTISGSTEPKEVIVGTTKSVSKTNPDYGYSQSYESGKYQLTGGMYGGNSGKRYIKFSIPANYTGVVYLAGSKSSDRKLVLVSSATKELHDGMTDGQATFTEAESLIYISLSSSKSTGSGTSASLASGDYYVTSVNGGLDITGLEVTLTSSPITATFKDGEVVKHTVSATANEELGNLFLDCELPELADHDGLTFLGWYNGENKVTAETTISASTTYTAKWQGEEHTVTYKADNGINDDVEEKYEVGKIVTVKECSFTVPEGKEFDQWIFTPTVTITEGKFTMPNQDVVITAQWKIHQLSSDAMLSDLKVDGTTVKNFAAGTFTYDVELPFGTTTVPNVTATKHDELAKSVEITPASAIPGTATIVVTAENDATQTYTINFTAVASKVINLVYATGKSACVEGTDQSAVVKSDDAKVSPYIKKISGATEGTSLNSTGTIEIKTQDGYVFTGMSFYGKIENKESSGNKLEISLDGGKTWPISDASNLSKDEEHCDVVSGANTNSIQIKVGTSEGVWIRNMQLIIEKGCAPSSLSWTEEPADFQKDGNAPIFTAKANNGNTISYSTGNEDIATIATDGKVTAKALGTVAIIANADGGDGEIYCEGTPEQLSKEISIYYLVKFDAQGGDITPKDVKYTTTAIAEAPSAGEQAGYNFVGWFDAAEGGNQITFPYAPDASGTLYAQWQSLCEGPTITTNPASANYLIGRTATNLVCEATPSTDGLTLTYKWYSSNTEDGEYTETTNEISTATASSKYYYCIVTEEGCAKEATSDKVLVTVAPKDGTSIIKAIYQNDKEAKVEGLYAGTASVKLNGQKLDKGDYYFYITLDGTTLLATDVLKVNLVDQSSVGNKTLDVYCGVGELSTLWQSIATNKHNAGDNTYTLTGLSADMTSIGFKRTDNTNNKINSIEILRPMNPILMALTIDGVSATINKEAKTIEVELMHGTNPAEVEFVPTILANDDAEHQASAALDGTLAYNTPINYIVTDKDGDQTVYSLTATEQAISNDATLQTIMVGDIIVPLQDNQYDYVVTLPNGTETIPQIQIIPNHGHAEFAMTPQDPTLGDQVTIVVTAEDETTTKTYTLRFNVSPYTPVSIFDGSTMTAIADSPESGLTWSVGSNITKTTEGTGTWNEKTYNFIKGFKANTGNNELSITIPNGYVAKFCIVGATNNEGSERSIFISKTATKTLDKTIVYSTNATYTAQGAVSEEQSAGTYYVGTTDSYRLYELTVMLRKTVQQLVNDEGTNEINILTDYQEENLVIAANQTVKINGNGHKIGNLTVENGGKLTLSGTLTVKNFTIDANQNNHVSGQIINPTNLTVTDDAYFDLTFAETNGVTRGWYAFTVPFPVSSTQGVYNANTGAKLTNEQGYAIMQYQGDVRAQGQYGWVKTHKKGSMLYPGILYIIAMGDTEYNRIRFVKNGGNLVNTEVAIKQFALNGGEDGKDNGWNAVGNPTLAYAKVANTGGATKAQFLDHENNVFVTNDEGIDNEAYVVGSAFFMQAANDATMTFTATSEGTLHAPARQTEGNSEFMLEISNAGTFQDRLFVSATDEATSTYEIGHDLVKMGVVDGTANVAQMAVTGYNNLSLCDAEFPLDENDQAVFPLTLTAPKAGTYTLNIVRACENQTLYLMHNNQVVWNLSQDSYDIDLSKGTNTEYSLMLHRPIHTIGTGNDAIRQDKTSVQKFIMNNQLIMIHNGRIYNARGAMLR